MKKLLNLFKKKEPKKSLKELQKTEFKYEPLDFRQSIFNITALQKVL